MDAVDVFYVVDALLASAVYAYGVSRMLPMRHPFAFGLILVGTLTFLNGVGFRFVDLFVGTVLCLSVQIVLPFFLFRGSAPVRAVTVLAACVCETLSMLALFAVFAIATGQVVPENGDLYAQFALSHLPIYAVSVAVSWIVLLSLMRLVSGVARRFSGVDRSRSSWAFVAFTLSHVVLLVLLVIVTALADIDLWFCVVSIAFCVLCFVADMLIYSSMERAIGTAKDAERARVLGDSLDACLMQCDAFVAEVEQTARMRHDVRNQAHAAMALAERGDYARAREHILSFRSIYLSKRAE